MSFLVSQNSMKIHVLILAVVAVASSFAQRPLQQMPSINRADSVSSFSRVAGIPGEKNQLNQQGSYVCPNDLADPKVQQALANMPNMFQQIQQNPQLMQQVQQQFNKPRFKAFNQFMATVNLLFKEHQITDIDPVRLCLDAEYRRASINQVASRLPQQEQRELLRAAANLENAASDQILVKQVQDELMQTVNQARQQLTSKDPQMGHTINELEQQQSQVIQCKQSTNSLNLKKSAMIAVVMIGSPLILVAGAIALLLILYGGGSTVVLYLGLSIPVAILHLLFILLTLVSNQGVFAALTGAALRFLTAGLNFIFSGFDGESRFDRNKFKQDIAGAKARWDAKDQGKYYYID